MADTQLEALVADVEAKETALATANVANTQAQAAAQAAVATAAGTAATSQSAQQDLSNSVDALVTFVETLKGAPLTTPTTGAAPTAAGH